MVCGQGFEPRREWHRHCSDACRAKQWRDRESQKATGKTLAADRNPEMLETFRRIARELGQDGDEVDIDNVRERAEQEGIQYTPGNWMGSVFNEPCWQFIRFRRATHASAHARPVGVWRLW